MEDEVVGRPVEASSRARPRTWRSASPAAATSASVGPAEVGVVAARARPRPRTASARRTGRRRPCRRPARRAGPARADSVRTSRHHGHSPSRMTNRAAPPSSSATRCGICGRSYRSRQRWFVRAPAWAPQFWTTWRWSVRPAPTRVGEAVRASASRRGDRLRSRRRGAARCSPGGATIVRQLPLARASASDTWATAASSSRASSLGPDDVEREVLERPDPDAVARGQAAVLAVAAVVDLVGRAGEPVPMEGAIDDRRDPPAGDRVLAELEQAGRHLSGSRRAAARARRPRSRRLRRRAGGDRRRTTQSSSTPIARRRPRRTSARRAPRRRSTAPRRAARPRARSRSRRRPGIPQASIRSKSARSGIDVQGDPVVADAALDADAERADLPRSRPVRRRPSSRDGRRAGRPRPRTRRTSRPSPPRAPGRAGGAAGRGATGRGSGRRRAGPGRGR